MPVPIYEIGQENAPPYSRDCIFPNYEDWCDIHYLDSRYGENHESYEEDWFRSNCRERAPDRGYERSSYENIHREILRQQRFYRIRRNVAGFTIIAFFVCMLVLAIIKHLL